jgi:nitrate/nitrite-specific signal transduction histidine kinase
MLDDAQRLLARAGQDAERRQRELDMRVRELEGNLSEMEELLVQAERHAARLANLYVASYQLHNSLETNDVRAAIADIAVNLLGAERFTIWLKDENGELWAATDASETDATNLRKYEPGDSLIDASLRNNAPQLTPCEGAKALAAVPFVKHGEAVGLLVIDGFLRQKGGLDADDAELLDLLAAHAASALLAARAFQVNQRKLTTYQGLLGFLRGSGT